MKHPGRDSSNFSPGPFDPRMGIQGMVTRTGWNGETWGANQRVSVQEALRINTLNGAWNSDEEAVKGSITTGKPADFVILADDPFTRKNRISGLKQIAVESETHLLRQMSRFARSERGRLFGGTSCKYFDRVAQPC